MEVAVIQKKETKLVPKLRFPEFNEGWISNLLGNVTNYTKGFAFKSDDYKSEGVRIVRVSDLGVNSIKKDIDKVFVDTVFSKSHGKYLLHKNNIIITTVGSKPEMIESAVGRGIFIYENNQGLLNQNMLKFENIDSFDNGFLQGIINSKRYQYFIKGIARGNANQSNITVKDLLNFKLNIPSLPEQQKIASFLSTVDTKIQQLQRKKELLEQYKKGAMQQIFSQKIRFKPALSEVEGREDDRSDYQDWEEKQLGDVLTFISTNSFSRNDLNYEEGEVYNIHYGDIHTKFKSNFHLSSEEVPFINSNISLSKISDEKLCILGDVVIADASEDYNDIGKAIEIINTNNQKIVAGLHTFLGRDFENSTIVGFKCYLFQTDYIRKQIMRIAQGISVLGISKKNLSKISFELPCKEEQQKIADFLSAIDNKIDKTVEQIESTQQFKKGLLQQMFV
ncbi:restriction endonuclease subunit S [Aquimarina algiphila]|uniref:Restriction endonuclease subunit S n=1 Tax=Aquimarina algiphila TaxID=2047982 RepID=A0A554VFG5_9FLAO|nr:restriction endonuclease subunit S [Aquimarina algiphila]TSE05867.1 restriction endonuclease subunit S [Aquimarina algiphila]